MIKCKFDTDRDYSLLFYCLIFSEKSACSIESLRNIVIEKWSQQSQQRTKVKFNIKDAKNIELLNSQVRTTKYK